MPTLLLLDGFRFFFYSGEGNEPPHVHIAKGDAVGKVWLYPEIQIAYLVGFTPREQKKVLEIVNTHHDSFKKEWNEYFSK